LKKNIFQFEAMTTPCEVVIYLENLELARDIAQEILLTTKELEKKYNYYDKNSLLSKINAREITELEFQTKELLQNAKSFYKSTNKAFDITVATLKSLFTLDTLPQFEKEKEKLLPFVGCDHFTLKKNKIVFDNPFTTLDLGGMVKEFAVDEAVKILRKRKISSALVNFGGDLFALGKKPDGEKFKIGIKNPQNPKENLLFVEISDEALTTSANYERNYTIQDKKFSHIISPKEKNQNIVSATIISNTTLISGVYSTSLMIDDTIQTRYKTIKIKSNMELEYENFNR